MSRILTEGFDVYGYDTSKARNWPADARWAHYDSNHNVDSTGGRIGACLFLSANNFITLDYYWTYLNLKAQYTTLIIGFAYKADNGIAPTGSFPILLFQKGSNPATDQQCCITRTSSDELQIRSVAGGAVLATSDPGVVTPGVYQYWEIKAYCHGSVGYVIIKIDGIEVINVTNINTQYCGSGAFQYIHWRSYTNSSSSYIGCRIDDLVIMDDTGTSFKDFMGDLQIVGHHPNEDGRDNDWTSTKPDHYDAIDDDGYGYNIEYIEDSTENHKDCFKITPSGTYPSILGVESATHGYNSGGGTAKITPYVIINDIYYYGDELTMPAGSTDKISYIWETNPATGTLWSKAVVAAAEFGFDVSEIS